MVNKTFTIKNVGTADLNLIGNPIVTIDNTSDFSILTQPTATSIAVSGMLTFTVKFDPVSVGTKTATIYIANDDADETLFNFSVQGTGLGPEIVVEGASMDIADGDTSPSTADDTDFGTATVNGSVVSKTFTIKNTGTGVLNLSGFPLVAIDNTTDFQIATQPTANSIAISGMLTFTVEFNPASEGTKTATIYIANDDGEENPFNFSLQGEGKALPDAPSVTMLRLCIGDTPGALTATGTNLLWYTAAQGGTSSPTAPTPTTTAASIQQFWVSQTVNNCESDLTLLTVNVEMCAPCTTNLILNNNPIADNIYLSDDIIESAGTVPIFGDVIFRAADEITLKPGFTAAAGADFLAKIEDCDPNTQFQDETDKTLIARNTTLSNSLSPTDELTAKVYPNPTSFEINVEVQKEAVGFQLELFDAMGRQINQWQFDQNKTTLSTDNLKGGLYFLRIDGVLLKKVLVVD